MTATTCLWPAAWTGFCTNAAGVFRRRQQIAGDRVHVDKIFPRRLADVLDGHAASAGRAIPRRPRPSCRWRAASRSGGPCATGCRSCRRTRRDGGSGALELLLRDAVLAQILDHAVDALLELVGGDALGGDGVEAEPAAVEARARVPAAGAGRLAPRSPASDRAG